MKAVIEQEALKADGYLRMIVQEDFILEEQSLARSIYDFLNVLKDGVFVCEQEKTLKYLEAVYEAY